MSGRLPVRSQSIRMFAACWMLSASSPRHTNTNVVFRSAAIRSANALVFTSIPEWIRIVYSLSPGMCTPLYCGLISSGHSAANVCSACSHRSNASIVSEYPSICAYQVNALSISVPYVPSPAITALISLRPSPHGHADSKIRCPSS